MTTEPQPDETNASASAPPTAVTPPDPSPAPVAAPPARPVSYAAGSPIVRIGLAVIAAALIFGSGFAVGHWAFERHDHRRPGVSARAQNFMQDMRQGRGGQSRSAPQMGQMPNLQQLLPLLEQLLNNGGRSNNNGSGSNSGGARGSNSSLSDLQRQVQQLQQQVQQLQDQTKNSAR